MNKNIKIFIASSNELKDEREKLSVIANELSNRMEREGITVLAVGWESADADSTEGRKQDEYNEKLRDCDSCIVMFWRKKGKYTTEELEEAYEERKKKNRLKKIYVLFKFNEESDLDAYPEIKDFYKEKFASHDDFPLHFNDFNSLKVKFLEYFLEAIKPYIGNREIISIEDGKIVLNGKTYVELNNLTCFSNNAEYKKVCKEIKITQRAMSSPDVSDEERNEYVEDLCKLTQKKTSMEKSIWNVSMEIARLRNSECSEKLKEAILLFESGNYKAADEALKIEDIDKDTYQDLENWNNNLTGLRNNANRYEVKANIRKLDYSEENLNSIKELYIKIFNICDVIKDEDFYVEKTINYVGYLRLSMHYNDALACLERAISKIVNKEYLAELKSEECTILLESNNPEVISFLESTVIIFKELANSNKEKYAREYAQLCCNLGTAYTKQFNRVKLGKPYHELAHDIFSQEHKGYEYSYLFNMLCLAEDYMLYDLNKSQKIIEHAELFLRENSSNVELLPELLTTKRLKLILCTLVIKLSYMSYYNWECEIQNNYNVKKYIEEGEAICKAYPSSVNLVRETFDFYYQLFSYSVFIEHIGDSKFYADNIERKISLIKVLGNYNLVTQWYLLLYRLECQAFSEEYEANRLLNAWNSLYYKVQYVIDAHLEDDVVFLQTIDMILASKFTQNFKNNRIVNIINQILDLVSTSNGTNSQTKLICFKIDVANCIFNFNFDLPDEQSMKKLTDLYKVYKMYYKNNVVDFKILGFIMAEFLNLCAYYAVKNNCEESLDLIRTALELCKADLDLYDSEAEFLCRCGRKKEALKVAMFIHEKNNEYYPEGNEYIFDSLMEFDEWKTLMIRDK